MIYHIGKNDVASWIDGNNPVEFLDTAPESIVICGVPFRWIGGSKQLRKNQTAYINTYQSEIQATNGEWPVFEIVVLGKRRNGAIKYVFDVSTFGTGLK